MTSWNHSGYSQNTESLLSQKKKPSRGAQRAASVSSRLVRQSLLCYSLSPRIQHFKLKSLKKTGSLFFPSLLSAKFPTPLLPLILINLEALFILVSHIHFQIRVESNRCQLTVCKYQQDANASQMGTSKCIWTFTQQILCSATLRAEVIWSF